MNTQIEEQLTVTIMRPTFVKGVPLEVGKTKTLPRKDALDLIGAGKAKETSTLNDIDEEEIEAARQRITIAAENKKQKSPSEIAYQPQRSNASKTQDEVKGLQAKKTADAKAKADAEAKG